MVKSSAERPPTGSSLPRSTVKKTQTLLGFFCAELIILTSRPPPQAVRRHAIAAAMARRRDLEAVTSSSRRNAAPHVNQTARGPLPFLLHFFHEEEELPPPARPRRFAPAGGRRPQIARLSARSGGGPE